MSYLLNALLENLSEIGFSTFYLNNQLEMYDSALQEEDYGDYQSSLKYIRGIKQPSICYPLTVNALIHMCQKDKANAFLAKLMGSKFPIITLLRTLRVPFQDNWIKLLEEKLGGSKGKAVRKALLSCEDYSIICWATCLWNLASADELQALFKSEKTIDFSIPLMIERKDNFEYIVEFIGVKKFISLLSKTSFKIKAEEYQITAHQIMKDCNSIIKKLMKSSPQEFLGLEKPRIKDFHDLHEWLWKQELEFEPSYSLNCQEIALPLDGLIVGEFQLEIPWTSKTLKEWGKKLSHCVGGYGSAINNDESIIVGVNKNSEPIYTIELTNNFYDTSWEINQSFGYKNIPAPEEVKETISKVILDIVNK